MTSFSGRNLRNRSRMSQPRGTRPSSLSASTALFSAQGSVLEERLSQLVVFEIRRDGNTEYSTMTLRALYNYVVSTITETCRAANNLRHTMKGQRAAPGDGDGSFRGASEDIMHHRQSISSYMSYGRARAGSASDAGGGRGAEEASYSCIGGEKSWKSTVTNDASFARQDSIDEGGAVAVPDVAASPSVRTPGPGSDAMPPHLPSLDTSKMSNHATPRSAAPADESDRTTDERHARTPTGAGLTGDSPSKADAPKRQQVPNANRERLGGYLHPRDMRRLVTPFSSSNEPQLIVRRHVMLLNFDPLRAIVLRDRLLVLVPDGADSILIELERRVRGGIAEMEDQVFGKSTDPPPVVVQSASKSGEKSDELFVFVPDGAGHDRCPTEGSTEEPAHDRSQNGHADAGWEDMTELRHEDMPFELQSVDAVLQTVSAMLREDARHCHNRSFAAMYELQSDSPGDHAQERLRLHKDEVKVMEARVQGFVRAMNDVLDEDEDLALMNLSKLITDPERFLLPVSQEVLHEESDEPELILEAYLQQALSIANGLDLLRGQIRTTEEQINMALDAIRNRILYVNTLLSVASLCVATGSFIGSIFGMNLRNYIEDEPTAFRRVTYGTVVGCVCMGAVMTYAFTRAVGFDSFSLGGGRDGGRAMRFIPKGGM